MRISDWSSDVCSSDLMPARVRHFLTAAVEEGLPAKSLDNAAMERLKAYRWPGNVRELENLVRRLAALYSQEVIGVDVIDTELAEAPEGARAPEEHRHEGLAAAVERHLREYFAAHKEGLPAAGLHERILQEIGRAPVCTPVTNSHLVFRILL